MVAEFSREFPVVGANVTLRMGIPRKGLFWAVKKLGLRRFGVAQGLFVFRQSDRSSSRVSACRVGCWSSPRRGRKAVATGEAAWRRCRRHRRGTRGMMVKTPDSPGRGGRRDALLPPLPGLWARGLATTGCTWPDCRRTAFHPWLQPAAPPGQKGIKPHYPKTVSTPTF